MEDVYIDKLDFNWEFRFVYLLCLAINLRTRHAIEMLHILLALFDRNEFVVAFGMYVVDESAEVTFAPYLYARRFFRVLFD